MASHSFDKLASQNKSLRQIYSSPRSTAQTLGVPYVAAQFVDRAIIASFGVMIALAYLIVFAPLVSVLVISFFDQEIVSFPPRGLTLHWYLNALQQQDLIGGLWTSLQVAGLATVIGVPLGTAAALGIARGNFYGKGLLSSLLMAPLVIPGIVAGTALFLYFVVAENFLDIDIKGTAIGLVAANVLLTIPWTVRLVSANLAGLEASTEEAAANLGASPFTVFRRITLPAMKSGIVAATIFSFVASFENLELNLLLVGPGNTTLPVAMMGYLEFRMDPTLAAMATMKVVLIAAMMLISDRFVKLSRVV